MEWFLNITPIGQTDDMDGVEMTSANSRQARGGGNGSSGFKGEYGSSHIGLATMMQDAIDFLGERSREDYAIWKADILASCDELEASSNERA
jgi:origin recognition complex subunit 6